MTENLSGTQGIIEGRYRRVRKYLAASLVCLLLAVTGTFYFALAQSNATARIREVVDGTKIVTENTNRELKILQQATGPDAQKAQNELLNRVLGQIDCNDRQVVREVLDVLVANHVLMPGTVGVRVDNCSKPSG